jgi:transcription initiation factor TFIIB
MTAKAQATRQANVLSSLSTVVYMSKSNNDGANKTKKIKPTELTQRMKEVDKKAMWAKFDMLAKDAGTSGAGTGTAGTSTAGTIASAAFDDGENAIAVPSVIECVMRSSGEREFCDCCQSNLVVTDEGFLGCTNRSCGVIYKDVLDQGAEWRYYGADDNHSGDPTRCGMPINPLLKESSFGCKVVCAPKSTYEMRKIRRYTEWQGMPYEEKARYEEFQRISVLGNQGGISKIIIDEAMRYHAKISGVKTYRGDNRDGIIAATIYIAARNNNCPRTAKEIATIFHLDNTSATRGCKNASSIINEIEHEMNNDEKTTLCSTTPLSFIERYCSRLSINAELTRLCKFIATRIQESNLIPENTPHSIAAGIVFFVSHQCKLNVSKKNVNAVSEISEVTINKCYKKLESMRDKLIPKVILEKYK